MFPRASVCSRTHLPPFLLLPGLFIPALPPKKALGILDDDFLVERLADLGDFLVRVSAHGMLRDCAAFRCAWVCVWGG
jgi:hypothetical protein